MNYILKFILPIILIICINVDCNIIRRINTTTPTKIANNEISSTSQILPAKRSRTPRIVGGIEAIEHSVPFIVSIALRLRIRGYRSYCAGSLITENWILTAAHCLNFDAFRIHLLMGHHNIKQFNNQTTQIRRSDYIIKHNEFETIGPYDIGLIHASRPFDLTTSYVNVIQLSQLSDPIGIVQIYGWGSISNTSERLYLDNLQTVNLTLVSNEYCQNSFNQITVDDDTNLCAGLPESNSMACIGDSGGPVVHNNTLIGIISWGPATCNSKIGPTVFTRINAYRRWIQIRIDNDLDADSNEYDYDISNENQIEDLDELQMTSTISSPISIISDHHILNDDQPAALPINYKK